MAAQFISDSIDAVPGLNAGVEGISMVKRLLPNLLDTPVVECSGGGSVGSTLAPAESAFTTLTPAVDQCQSDVVADTDGDVSGERQPTRSLLTPPLLIFDKWYRIQANLLRVMQCHCLW